MKKLLLLLACIAISGASPASTSTTTERVPKKVYICTGKSAKVYHYDRDCKGLNACKASIKKVDIDVAKEMGRRPCKMCAH